MGRRPTLKRNYDNEGNLISKECSCCHEIKLVSEFNKYKSKVDGLQTKCKKCFKKYREKNKESIKEYYRENKESIKEYQKRYRQENSGTIKQYRKKYYQENSGTIKEKSKKYYQENKESKKEYDKKYRQVNSDTIKEKSKKRCQKNKEFKKEYDKKRRGKQRQEALQQIKIELESNPRKYNYIKGKEIYGIIYLVYNTESNKYYVGQTTIGFDNRYPSGWLYYHRNKELIKEDLQLYGENSFKYNKLFKVAHSQYELDKLEAYYIDYYDSYENGYNENRGNIFTNRGKEK